MYNLIYSIENLFRKSNYLTLFNIKIYTSKGTMYIIKSENQKNIKINDTIIYNESNQIKVKKVSNKYSDNGKTFFKTKNKNVFNSDIEEQNMNNIIGKVICSIPIIGFLLSIFESKITTTLIIIVLIFYYFYNKELRRRKRIRKMKRNAYYI